LETIKKSGNAGKLLWLWPIVMAAIHRRRDIDDYAIVDSSAYVQFIFIAICGLTLIFKSKYKWRCIVALACSRPICWLCLYTLLSIISFLWSADWVYTCYRGLECLIFLTMILTICERFKNELNVFVDWFVLWAIFVGLIDTLLPWIYGRTTFDNINIMRVVAGAHVYGPILFLGCMLSSKRWARKLLIFMCIASTSTRIYIGAFVGLAFAAALRTNRKIGTIFVISIFAIVSVVVFSDPQKITHALFIGKSEEVVKSGTGRFTLWREYRDIIADSPFIGNGFSASERIIAQTSGVRIPDAHNSLLAAMAGTGIGGAALVLILLVDMIYQSFTMRASRIWGVPLVASASMIAFVMMFSTGVGGRVNGAWISVALFAGLVSCVVKKFPKRV